MRRHGLFLNHVEYFPDLHGGTLRWHIGPNEAPTPTALAYLEAERRRGLTSADYYQDFASRVDRIARRPPSRCSTASSARASRSPPTAPPPRAARSQLRSGIGTDLVDFVVDRNVHKQGLLMPGVHHPDPRPDRSARASGPTTCCLLAWNFEDRDHASSSPSIAAPAASSSSPCPSRRSSDGHRRSPARRDARPDPLRDGGRRPAPRAAIATWMSSTSSAGSRPTAACSCRRRRGTPIPARRHRPRRSAVAAASS